MNACVDVVIPAFNNHHLTAACVGALNALADRRLIASIVVSDDASTSARSVHLLRSLSGITRVVADVNRGFAAACNVGARVGRAPLLLLLNTDAYLHDGAVTILAGAFDEASVGICAPKLLYGDGTIQHAGLALLPGPVSRWWHVHRHRPADVPDANVPRDLLAVTGAALMVRRTLFGALGGFDEGFVNGWEDVDLCLRVWSAGARVRYVPSATAVHLEGATRGTPADETANERRFIDRWTAALAVTPRVQVGDVPPLAIIPATTDVNDSDARRLAIDAWQRAYGARVTTLACGDGLTARKLDIEGRLAKRGPAVQVSWGRPALSSARRQVVYLAPRDVAEARRTVRRLGSARAWVPTRHARDLLYEAGADERRIAIVRIPQRPPLAPPIARDACVIAYDAESDATAASAVDSRAMLIPTTDARWIGADVYVARDGGDRYGLRCASACANGAIVVSGLPLHPALLACDAVANPADWRDAIREAVRAADQRRSIRWATIALNARILDPNLATAHATEDIRAFVHGEAGFDGRPADPATVSRLRAVVR